MYNIETPALDCPRVSSGVAGPLAAQGGGQICRPFVLGFYAPQLYRQVLLRRVLAMAILSVCLSVRPSQPGAEPSPGEIETSGLHHMVAWRI